MRNLVLLLSASILFGCMGNRINLSNKTIVNDEAEVADVLSKVGVYRITPTLIAQLNTVNKKVASGKSRPATNKRNYKYFLGKGDILSISTWKQPDSDDKDSIKSHVVVNSKGNIYYPYVGNFSVVGKTAEDVQFRLTKKLSEYLSNPQLKVYVEDFKSKKIYVTGEVTKPGIQKITNIPLTVLDALSYAGGVTKDADWHRVTLNRKNIHYPISLERMLQKGDLKYNYLMKDGDVINVARNDNKVYVMGEVLKPQTLNIGHYGLTLTGAISEVGGIDARNADPTGIFVIRNIDRKNQHINKKTGNFFIANIYQLNTKDVTAFALGDKFALNHGDIVYVTVSPISHWNRVLSKILPTVSAANTVESVAK